MRVPALAAVGLATEVVYLAAATHLPWPRYGWGLNGWRQILDGAGGSAEAAGARSALAAVLAAALLLFAAYAAGWRLVRRAPASRAVVWGGALLFNATLFWLMPITSDLFGYLVQAHQFTDLGANPLAEAPIAAGADPVALAYPAVYLTRPSVYGPAWLLISSPGTLGRSDLVVGLAYLKGVAALAFLGSAWFVERLLSRLGSREAIEGLYLFAWNPLLLLTAVGDGHNDVAMVALLLLATWWLFRRRWLLAFAALALSAWTKYVAALFVPLFLAYVWYHGGARRRGDAWPAVLGGVAALCLVSVAVLFPFGDLGWLPGWVDRLLRPVNWRGASLDLVGRALTIGLALFGLLYIAVLWRLSRAPARLTAVLDAGFVLLLSLFVLGFSRSQPWHLIWAAALAGFSSRRWAWPAVAGLSALLFVAQVWVEWGAPGWGF